MAATVTQKIALNSPDEAIRFFGSFNQNIQLITDCFAARIIARGNEIKVVGDEREVQQITRVLSEMRHLVAQRGFVNPEEIKYSIKMIKADPDVQLSQIFSDSIPIYSLKKHIAPRTAGQKQYIDAIRQHDIVFAIGPAGTGKTYLAMAMALAALKIGKVKKIILTRPAVEAGEKLGFLPGDLFEKVNPYLRPLYDALYDMMELKKVERLMSDDVIEVVPLAFMRGRTLHKSFVILDEAQNCTQNQMKMFLTRLGVDSKAVINGDVTQIDLPSPASSGLVEAARLLREINGVEFVFFDQTDVVRHELVAKIIAAYQEDSD